MGYELTSRDEGAREMPELIVAVGGWLGKQENRKEGWQFKCTIAAGKKVIIKPHSGRFRTFVVNVNALISANCSSLLARRRQPFFRRISSTWFTSCRDALSSDIIRNHLITMIYDMECSFYCLDKHNIRACRSGPTTRIPGYHLR
jgi:hypothetical protein